MTDPRSWVDFDLEEALHSIIDDRLSYHQTAIPVKVVKDSDGHTVSLQPLVKSVQKMPDGTTKIIDMPVLPDVPVQFASGGGVTVTHPIKESDEGLAIFASSGIDNWHQEGGAQKPKGSRQMSLSDAFYIPGVRSNPRKLENVSTTSTQMRSDDGAHVLDLHPENGFTQTTDKPMNFTGEIHITGDLIVNGIRFSTHVHGGIERGGADTDKPHGGS